VPRARGLSCQRCHGGVPTHQIARGAMLVSPLTRRGVWAGCCAPPQKVFFKFLVNGSFFVQIFLCSGKKRRHCPVAP